MKILVTSALPYANGPIHLGHLAGCYLPADIYFKFQKYLMKRDVIHICGTDEHGVPIIIEAEKRRITPRELVDFYHKDIKETFDELGIEFTYFSGTAREIHYELAQSFFKKIYEKGYKTIADIAKFRIRNATKKIQEELVKENEKLKNLDLGFKVFKVEDSNFKQWKPFIPKDLNQVKSSVLDYSEIVKPGAEIENILYELLLKNGKKLTDKIDRKNNFYIINNKELVFLLETVNKDIINEILKLKPQKVIAVDKIFNGNDQLRTNMVLLFKNEGIEFKSV
ncbi:MAG: class I tRNA ligase family protein [candidate division WOR-3 bacterium]